MYEVLDIDLGLSTYIYTDVLYKDSLSLSNPIYEYHPKDKFITKVIIPEGLTKPSVGDIINVVEFQEKIIMFNSVNPVSSDVSTTTKENNYKKTSVNNGYINAYAYITIDQFKNTQAKDKIYILKGYVPATEDGMTVQEKKEHPIVVMKNFEWWLQKIDQSFGNDQVLEVKVSAQVKNFNYNNKYDPSFWLNPSQKTFEYQFITTSDMMDSIETNESNNFTSEENSEPEQKSSNFVNKFFNPNNTTKTKTSLKTFVDDNIKLRNEILTHLMGNPDCENYLITLQRAGFESSVDCLHTLVTSIMIEYNRNN